MAYNPLSEAEKTFILHGVQVITQDKSISF